MTDLCLPAPARLALGHKLLRDHMLSALDLPLGTTVFDLAPGKLMLPAVGEPLAKLATVLQRPAVSNLPVRITPDAVPIRIEQALLRQGMTAAKLLPRYLHDWDSSRPSWRRGADEVRHILEAEQGRFGETGFLATDPELMVPPQRVADDVTVVEVLTLLADGQIPLMPWRPWLETVVAMPHAAPDEGSREARLRWHIAMACQHVRSSTAMDALEKRFGLDGEDWTLEECGRFCGMSRERVRQLDEQVRERISADRYLSPSEGSVSDCGWRAAA